MKIVQGDKVPMQERGLPHREGTFRFIRLMEGEPGTLGNFQFSLSHTTDDFFSPRHRHNFEQYRFQIEGTFEFGRNGTMKPGMVGYFPEGVPYGPQTSDTSALVAVLQFGGASGSGYLAHSEVQRANNELREFGSFKGGIFRRNPGVPGKRQMDGFQAIWEHVSQRPMVYPKPRYPAPMLLDPTHSEWVPVPGATGVFEKLLGVFSERRTEASFLRLEPGARHTVIGRGLHLGLSGTGKVAGEELRRFTTLHLETGERAELAASKDAVELLHLGLPYLADLEATGKSRVAAAAE